MATREALTMVQLVAHRSRVGDDPENTVIGLHRIPPWVDAVEIDARLTADGACILMHDSTLDRTTDGTGPVSVRTWKQLRDIQVAGKEPVTRLSRFLREAERTWLDVFVDLKDDSQAAVHAATETIFSSPMVRRCVLLLRTSRQLRWAQEGHPNVRLGVLGVTVRTADKWTGLADDAGAEIIFIAPGDTTYLENRGAVSAIVGRGIRAGASLVNDLDIIDAASVDGCSAILTDRGLELLQWKQRVAG